MQLCVVLLVQLLRAKIRRQREKRKHDPTIPSKLKSCPKLLHSLEFKEKVGDVQQFKDSVLPGIWVVYRSRVYCFFFSHFFFPFSIQSCIFWSINLQVHWNETLDCLRGILSGGLFHSLHARRLDRDRFLVLVDFRDCRAKLNDSLQKSNRTTAEKNNARCVGYKPVIYYCKDVCVWRIV